MTSPLQVRASVEGDFDQWFALMAEVAAEGRWIGTELPMDRAARQAGFAATVRDDQAASFLAVAGDRLVGTLGIRCDHGVAELGMAVSAEARGRGAGSALMETALAWAGGAGAHKVTLSVFPHNHRARALYAKFGFVSEGTLRRHHRRRGGQLWDAVVMGLVLDTTSPGSPRERGGAGPGHRVSLELHPAALAAGAGVVLRPWRLADAAALVAGIDEAEVHRWLDGLPDPYTVEDAHAFLSDARRSWAEATAAPLAITIGDEPAGGICLALDSRVPGVGELGYWVAAPARRRGVASAAAEAVVAWAFGPVGLHRVELHAAVDNLASRRVAERAGFQQEGIKRRWRRRHGRLADFALYACTA